MLVDADYIARSGTSLEIVNLVVFEVDSENENIIANISEKFVIALVANESIVADARHREYRCRHRVCRRLCNQTIYFPDYSQSAGRH